MLNLNQEKIALGAPQRHKLSVHVISDVAQESSRPEFGVNGENTSTVSSDDNKGDDGLIQAPVLPVVSILFMVILI